MEVMVGMFGTIGILAVYDLMTHRCPNWLSIPLIVLGIAMTGPKGMWTCLLTICMVLIAQFPAGDVKGAGAMAAWVPIWAMLPGLLIAMMITVLIMETQWYKLYQQAHRWPWLAGLAICLTLTWMCGILFF